MMYVMPRSVTRQNFLPICTYLAQEGYEPLWSKGELSYDTDTIDRNSPHT